jgi:signal transduction histidine kinase
MKPDVLIADASFVLREELQALFERAQLSTTACASAAEVRHALGSHTYALVVLGLVLSDGDGIDLIPTIEAARTPILLLSSKAAVASRILALGVVPDDYAEPPCDRSDLVFRARALIRRHRFVQALGVDAALARQVFTELADENAELWRAQRISEQSQQLKSEFLSNMSHELRTPLNAILGFGQLLHDDRVASGSTRHQEYLGYVLSSSRQLLALITDVLDLVKVEAGKIVLAPESCDPTRIVEDVITVLRSTAHGKNLELHASFDPKLGLVVIDPGRFKQVLYNYVSNAIAYARERGTVQVRLVADGEAWFVIEVQDDGNGIAPDEVGRAFVEFMQQKIPNQKQGGSGLGLAYAKRLVEVQGGQVGARSELGHGSTFFARLPRIMVARS